MKAFTKISFGVILFLCTTQSKAQWTQSAFKDKYTGMLKFANGKLFTYAIDLSAYQGGLYFSDDNGNTWVRSDTAGSFNQIFVHDITYDSAHSDYVVVASAQQGVYYSSDGFTWTNSGTNWSGEAVEYINGHDVLSNGNSGPAISTDGGQSWNSSVAGLTAPFYDHSIVNIHDTLFLSQQGIVAYISTNGGSTWVRHDSDMNYFVNCFFEHKNVVYGGLYLAGVAYYKDRHWVFDSVGLHNVRNTWALSDAGDTLFCGGDSGVWMNNTGRWENFSCGLPSGTVYRLQHIGHFLFAGTDSGIFKIDLTNNACGASGVEQITATNDEVKIAPTITDDLVNIYTSSIPQKVEVVNVSGQVKQITRQQKIINVHELAPGIYFLRITMNSGQVFTDKIIRQ